MKVEAFIFQTTLKDERLYFHVDYETLKVEAFIFQTTLKVNPIAA